MGPKIFRSATAMVMIASLSAPMQGFAQEQAQEKAGFDLLQMNQDEIAELIERCRKRAERHRGGIAEGEQPENPKGKFALFCNSYGDGAFDDILPEGLQSSTVFEEGSAEESSTELADESPKESSETAEYHDKPAETIPEVQSEPSMQALDEPVAEPELPTDEETAANQPEQTAIGETADESNVAEELSGGDAPSKDGEPAQNPEIAKLDSQQQADALAENENTNSVAAAATSGAQYEAEAEVIEETVTAEMARSSAEEFATKVDETAKAEAVTDEAAEQEDKDSGLSNLEKAALLGLGALAVGKLLNSGEKVVSNSGDRAVVEQNGQFRVLKNDDALLRQPGANVTTYRFGDGSTRTVVTRENGVDVETIRAADGRVLRRSRTLPDGSTVVLFDDTQRVEQVQISELPPPSPTRAVRTTSESISAEELALALAGQTQEKFDRRFSLAQIRNIDAVRRLVPEISVDQVTFDTGSSAIQPTQAEELAGLGSALRKMIDANPAEVFLIEGHTDAVGAAGFNLALSDRRAETVALALTEYFDVPPENMVVQGYGEGDLAVPVLVAERANRRVSVRRITPLLHTGQ